MTPYTSTAPKLLDAFCRKGGAAMGYLRAGFEVYGVDIENHADGYPGHFVQGDAVEYIHVHGHEFDAIHASPPCQDRIAITAGNRARKGWADRHIDLVPQTRAALATVRRETGVPTVMECGVGKHLRRDLMLCGLMFGLGTFRHRWIEVDGPLILAPTHPSRRGHRVAGWRHGVRYDGDMVAVYGDGGGKGSVRDWQQAMGIDWMDDRADLVEAVPPAYAEYIGGFLMAELRERAA